MTLFLLTTTALAHTGHGTHFHPDAMVAPVFLLLAIASMAAVRGWEVAR